MTGRRKRRIGVSASVMLCALFFSWGLISVLVDLTVPFLKSYFGLGYAAALLLQSSYFLAYLFLARIAGVLISRTGLKRGVVVGLLLMVAGCLAVVLSSFTGLYWPVLPATFTLAAGVAFLQVAANPLAAGVGSPLQATRQLTFAQGFNSLGAFVAPFAASIVLFAQGHLDHLNIGTVRSLYGAVALWLLLLAALAFRFISDAPVSPTTSQTAIIDASARRRLALGAAAIFLYVGAEVSISSTLINFLTMREGLGVDAQEAARLVGLFWGGALVGRFAGAALVGRIAPPQMLAAAALGAGTLALLGAATTGPISGYALLAIGFFNSIQFPTIFALASAGLAPAAQARASGWLCTAIVGGGVTSLIFGLIADAASLKAALVAPIASYAYIAWFAAEQKRA